MVPVDPFADAPAIPADPFADAPAASDPFAAPTASVDPFADAPPASGDGLDDAFLTDPTTGLLSLFGTIDEFTPLPPRLDLTTLTSEPGQAVLYANPNGTFHAIGGFCNPEGGGQNGFVVELASPAFAGYGEAATLVLYVDGLEIGYAELGVYADDAGSAGFVLYDEDELGILRALDAFEDLEAVLTGDGVEVAEAHWAFVTADLRAAIAALPCAP